MLIMCVEKLGYWVGGWMDGWMDGRKEAKAGLRIAYSNQKLRPFIANRVTESQSYTTSTPQGFLIAVSNP